MPLSKFILLLHQREYFINQSTISITFILQPTSEEGYQEPIGHPSDPGRSKTSRLDLAARSGEFRFTDKNFSYLNKRYNYSLLIYCILTNHFSKLGFSNPFGYLMGNGGLCGGRGDNKASGTSEANNFTNQSQR